jgi:phosphoglycerol transferase MdoB-like AlkP superfamily enzyme
MQRIGLLLLLLLLGALKYSRKFDWRVIKGRSRSVLLLLLALFLVIIIATTTKDITKTVPYA